MEAQASIPVHNYYIDTNQHMNNGKYVLVALEYLPEDFPLREIRVEYKKAATLSDILYPAVSITGECVTVALNDEVGKPYAIIIFLK